MNANWLACSTVREHLTRVGPALERAVVTPDGELADIAHHLIASSGKRLRPALLLLAHGDQPADRSVIDSAAAVELIHLASLYHDDIMDRSATRRGDRSVNARWGNAAAATGGTFLFARSQLLLSTVGKEAVELASSATASLCAGQLREAENAYNLELTIGEHLEILRLKTATLFALAAALGARLAQRAEPYERALATYAAHLGLAFQLYDDVLDWIGNDSETGKSAGTDIRGGIYNLPLLRVLADGGDAALRLRLILMKRRIDDADLATAMAIVASRGVEEGRCLAQAEADQAIAALDGVPQGTVRASLEALARFAVSRKV